MKVVTLIVLAAGAGIIAYRINQSKNSGYVTEAAKNADVTEVVTETGVVVAGGQADVYSPTNGIITEVPVKNGDTVAQGDTLFSVRSTATRQEQQAASAAYLTAKNTLNAAQAEEYTLRSSMYTYWKTYYDKATSGEYQNGDGSPKTTAREAAAFQSAQDDWLAAEKSYRDQQTAVAAAQANVASTYAEYQATQNADVTAPSAGSVANLSVATGESVRANPGAAAYSGSALGTVTGMPVLSLVTSKSIEMRVPFGQTDIAKIKPGQKAAIVPDAYPDKTYKGTVVRTDSIGQDISGVVKYNVYIAIADADDELKAGMTGDATVTTKSLKDVLSVPNSAIKLYQGGKAVQVFKSGKKGPQYIPVDVGVKGDQRTQILKGITAGQQVITALTNEQIKRSSLFGF